MDQVVSIIATMNVYATRTRIPHPSGVCSCEVKSLRVNQTSKRYPAK
jgi:hypothetical protein